MESFESGSAMGYPVVDVEAVLTGGSFKETNGTELAYTVSASMAVKEALSKGEPFLLEPIMKVEVFVPEAFMGEVIGDLNSRGGKIENIEPKADTQIIKANCSSVQNVWLFHLTPVRHPGKGDIHHAVFTF